CVERPRDCRAFAGRTAPALEARDAALASQPGRPIDATVRDDHHLDGGAWIVDALEAAQRRREAGFFVVRWNEDDKAAAGAESLLRARPARQHGRERQQPLIDNE